jgi:hypothetical protein
MKVCLKTAIIAVILMCGGLVFPTTRSFGAVIVYDRVTTLGTPVYLKVLTKGRIFADGGRLVDFFIDDQRLGQNLTGSDGYGYRKYIPKRPGIIKVRATSDGESGNGLVLVMKKTEKAVLIEIEGGFKDAYISDIAAGAARQAVKQLLKNYRVIYLSRNAGIRMARAWLDEMDFPDAPLLRWQGVRMLDALKDKDVQLHAIIGAAGVIEAAADHIEKRFTFDQTQKGQTIKDWHELLTALTEPSSGKSENKKQDSKP